MRILTNKKPFLEEGDIIELTDQKVYADVPSHFAYSNCRGQWNLVHTDVSLDDDNFDYLRGKYIVVKTTRDGGGCGHGAGDGYPDGHHVWCEQVQGDGKIDFYQSGCFTAMICDIKPIEKAERVWKIKNQKG